MGVTERTADFVSRQGVGWVRVQSYDGVYWVKYQLLVLFVVHLFFFWVVRVRVGYGL